MDDRLQRAIDQREPWAIMFVLKTQPKRSWKVKLKLFMQRRWYLVVPIYTGLVIFVTLLLRG